MTAHSRPIVLQESLIGRRAAEGLARLVWIIGVSAFKHGVAFAAVFMSFAGLWHLRMHGAVGVGTITGACCLGMITGMTGRIAVVVIGREMAVYPGRYVILYDGGDKGRRWSFEQLSDVRILDGPKQWTTVEIDIWRSPRRPTIRFVAKCTEEERKSLNNALAMLDPEGRGASDAPSECGNEIRGENHGQADAQSAEQITKLRYRILLGILIGIYAIMFSGVALSALEAIIAGHPGPLLLGALMLATGGPAALCLHYFKARLKRSGDKGKL